VQSQLESTLRQIYGNKDKVVGRTEQLEQLITTLKQGKDNNP
jgi:hypothetical protein